MSENSCQNIALNLKSIETSHKTKQFQVDGLDFFLWAKGEIERDISTRVKLTFLNSELVDVTEVVKGLRPDLFDSAYKTVLDYALDEKTWEPEE